MKAPRVSLEQWRTLQAVVDNGGFAQAAKPRLSRAPA
jgi:DNA-binding transcriptional LysR family regulator